MPFQDLSRVDDIVNQARGLADNVRAGVAQPLQQTQMDTNTSFQSHRNPFSPNPESATVVISSPVMTAPQVAFQSTSGTGVNVTDSNIQISAGGRQFNIPRITTGSVPIGAITRSPSAPTIAVGPGNNSFVEVDVAAKVDAYRSFASAVSKFRNSDFQGAAKHMQIVNEQLPGQSAFNQFHALTHFANGDYDRAAEFAYATSAAAPLWNWQQLKAYYGDVDHYSQRYLHLQNAAMQQNVTNSTRFLLGYHHLMLGHCQHARQQFEAVLREMPSDPVTKGLLEMTQQVPPAPAESLR